MKPILLFQGGIMGENKKDVIVYRNEDIKRVIAFIPPGHMHVRVLIETKDKIIVFQEATIAGIIRAYVNVGMHPYRKALELQCTRLGKDSRKIGFAEYQLIESSRSEKNILDEVTSIISMSG